VYTRHVNFFFSLSLPISVRLPLSKVTLEGQLFEPVFHFRSSYTYVFLPNYLMDFLKNGSND